jgi:hypothetical protein
LFHIAVSGSGSGNITGTIINYGSGSAEAKSYMVPTLPVPVPQTLQKIKEGWGREGCLGLLSQARHQSQGGSDNRQCKTGCNSLLAEKTADFVSVKKNYSRLALLLNF